MTDITFFLHALDCNGNTVRDFFFQTTKGFFADQFSHDLAHRLIRHRVFIIEGLTIGQILQDTLYQSIRIVTFQRRNRNNLRKIQFLPIGIDKGQDLLLFHRIHFVYDQDNWCFRLLQLFDNVALTGSDKGSRLHQPADDVHLVQGPFRHRYHIITQLIFCLMDARRIQKNDLPFLQRQYGLNPISGRLRLIGSDRDLLPDQMIHQGRFPDVGTTDQSNKTRFKLIPSFHFISS